MRKSGKHLGKCGKLYVYSCIYIYVGRDVERGMQHAKAPWVPWSFGLRQSPTLGSAAKLKERGKVLTLGLGPGAPRVSSLVSCLRMRFLLAWRLLAGSWVGSLGIYMQVAVAVVFPGGWVGGKR